MIFELFIPPRIFSFRGMHIENNDPKESKEEKKIVTTINPEAKKIETLLY